MKSESKSIILTNITIVLPINKYLLPPSLSLFAKNSLLQGLIDGWMDGRTGVVVVE
jgi:hypothetical protein